MPTVLHQEVVSLNKQAGEIKLQAKEINDGNLPNKEELLKGLTEDYRALNDKGKVLYLQSYSYRCIANKEQEALNQKLS
jgi:hypothetical protein